MAIAVYQDSPVPGVIAAIVEARVADVKSGFESYSVDSISPDRVTITLSDGGCADRSARTSSAIGSSRTSGGSICSWVLVGWRPFASSMIFEAKEYCLYLDRHKTAARFASAAEPPRRFVEIIADDHPWWHVRHTLELTRSEPLSEYVNAKIWVHVWLDCELAEGEESVQAVRQYLEGVVAYPALVMSSIRVV